VEIIFEGDFSDREICERSAQLKKFLGTGDGGGAEATVQLTVAGMLSPRQRKLIDLWRKAGECKLGDDRCDDSEPESWEDYDKPLGKAAIGAIQYRNGKPYVFNKNHRWESHDATATSTAGMGNASGGRFSFLPQDGEYGKAVYLPIERSSLPDALILRCSLNIAPSQMISGAEFLALENNLAQDIDLTLNSKNIRAIVETHGETVTLLCIRDPGDIEVMGMINGSVPEGEIKYKLVGLQEEGDRMIVEIQAQPMDAQPLDKSATVSGHSTWQSES